MSASEINLLILISFGILATGGMIFYFLYISIFRRNRLLIKIAKKIGIDSSIRSDKCLYGNLDLDVLTDSIGLYKQDGYTSVVYYIVLSYPFKSEKVFYNDYGMEYKRWNCSFSPTSKFKYKYLFDKGWYFAECDGSYIRFYYHLPIMLSSTVINRVLRIHEENLEKLKRVPEYKESLINKNTRVV